MSLLLLFRKYIFGGLGGYLTVNPSNYDIEVLNDVYIDSSNADLNLSLTLNNSDIYVNVNESDFDFTFYPLDSMSKLRYDDIALIKYIRQFLVQQRILNIQVIDGYPDSSESSLVTNSLTIPLIAVEHVKSYKKYVELKEHLKSNLRTFECSIFGRTKGELDSLVSLLALLEGHEVITDDQRHNTIKKVSSRTSISNDKSLSSQFQKKYWCVNFTGANSFACLNHNSEFELDNFSLFFDIKIPFQDLTERKYLLDKYIESSQLGYRLYIDEAGYLVFEIGNETYTFYVDCDFGPYFDKRIELGIVVKVNSLNNLILQIFINSELIETSLNPLLTDLTIGSKNMYFGCCFNNLIDSNHLEYCLYGFRFSKTSFPEFGTNGEFLVYDELNDIVYLKLEEGLLNIGYDSSLFNLNNVDLNLIGNYYWNNYKISKINGLNFFSATCELILEGKL